MDGRAAGSRPTSSASPTVYSPSTGTSCKTKQPRKSRKAGCRCSVQRTVTSFSVDQDADESTGEKTTKRTQPTSIGELQYAFEWRVRTEPHRPSPRTGRTV